MQNKEIAINQLIEIIADAIVYEKELDPALHGLFFQSPEISIDIIKMLDQLDESLLDENEEDGTIPACVYALEICLSQLQAEIESGARNADRTLKQCMHQLAECINQENHTLPFWLPALNAFYDVGVELTEELKLAYFNLAQHGYPEEAETEYDHIEAIKALIAQSQDLSDYEIAENFFSQTYAMPPEFFVDLILDLMALDEGQNIGLLFLLHPNSEVRYYVVEALDEVMEQVKLEPIALTRLQMIAKWYPQDIAAIFNRWIKHQRKLGVVFAPKQENQIIQLKATEVDGAGSQGLFVQIKLSQVKEENNQRLCGLLFKGDSGIKDVWLTQPIDATQAKTHLTTNLQDNVTLRNVDNDYCVLLVNHFMKIMQAQQQLPGLSFMHLQELIPLNFTPELINIDAMLAELSHSIVPFTQDMMHASFKRSKQWISKKSFTDSWFSINADIDRLVNQHASIIDGVKRCDIDKASEDVMANVFEKQRDSWLFHFVWMALWMKSCARKNEKAWMDCVFIAYAIENNTKLSDIPLINELCTLSVKHSIETMQDRKTHLH